MIWSVTGDEGLPKGTFFGLYLLFILCSLAGLLTPLIKLPPLLGELSILVAVVLHREDYSHKCLQVRFAVVNYYTVFLNLFY